MYTAGRRGTVRLLLVVAFVVAVAGVQRWPRQPRSKTLKLYRPNKNAAKLLNHVMMYEKEWTDVLQESIRLLDEPPYKGRYLAMPPLMPKTDEASSEGPQSDKGSSVTKKMHLYDVHDIVTKVTEYYSPIGSFVEFGAKVVRRALACYTFKRVFYQLKSIYNLLIKNAEPNVVLQVATAFKKNNVSFIDILSAVPDGDLSIILHAYWESIKLLQFDGIQHLNDVQYPENLVKNMSDLIIKINKFLNAYCIPHPTDIQLYSGADIPTNNPLISDPSLELVMTVDDIVTMTLKQALHMAWTASSLGIVTMSNHLWSSLFFYRGCPRPDNTYVDVDAPPSSEASQSETGDIESDHIEAGHSKVSSTTSGASPN